MISESGFNWSRLKQFLTLQGRGGRVNLVSPSSCHKTDLLPLHHDNNSQSQIRFVFVIPLDLYYPRFLRIKFSTRKYRG